MPENEKKRWYEYVFDSLDFLDVIGWIFEGIVRFVAAIFEGLF